MEGFIGRPVKPFDVGVDVAVGRGTDDGRMDDQVFEIPFSRHLLKLPHGGGFHVENPHGFPLFEQFLSGRIVQGIESGIVQAHTRVPLHGGQRVPDHRQGPVSQEVDLDESSLFRLILFPLNDAGSLGAHLHGHITGNVIGHEHHPPTMDGKVPRQKL